MPMQGRECQPLALACLGQYPVLTLLGPRQSGKTTLAQAMGAQLGGRPYANLEEPEQRRFASDDARGFLAGFPAGGIIDEIQRVPELLSWIQVDVDRHGQPGRWILTGSHQPALRGGIAQSLARRTALVDLHPFSLAELAGAGASLDLERIVVEGGYPRRCVAGIPPSRFASDYVATYVERDLRQLAALRDLAVFQRYLGLLAGRIGAPVNWSSLGADAGVSEITAKTWAGLLEASFLAFPLRPWFANIGKRLKRHPKYYLTDTGLMAYLVGITDPAHVASHPLRGALVENLIIGEAHKALAHWGSPARLHVFASAQHEVDLLVELGGRTLAVEIKAGRTIAGDWFQGLAAVAALPAVGVDQRLVVYAGDEEQQRSEVTVCPWWAFPAHLAAWLHAHQGAGHAPPAAALRERLQVARSRAGG